MSRRYYIDIKTNKANLLSIFHELLTQKELSENDFYRLLKRFPRDNGQMFSKSALRVSYNKLKSEMNLSDKDEKLLLSRLRMKKVRTISGVTPVTVLTKPFPCPGRCIFCPNDVRMPKSYLSDEPGAQRAEMNKFDPYLQTFNRLVAFRNTGHPTAKNELLILGGTWSSYPEGYQIWFVKRCFDAFNDFETYEGSETLSVDSLDLPYDPDSLEEIDGTKLDKSYNRVISGAIKSQVERARFETATWEELFEAHKKNETAKTKCIGLVLETRPDEIDEKEVIKIRKLGATRVQLGIQSLNDEVLKLNKRGHNVAKTQEAFNLLRLAGFKILGHYMPNLYGSTPEQDKKDYLKMFSVNEEAKVAEAHFDPDELKIYPCSLIGSAELMQYFKKGLWKPYSKEELLDVVTHCILNTPRYCRLMRVIRDIPSTDIVVGNKLTNFRQIAEGSIKDDEQRPIVKEIRSREIKDDSIDRADLTLKITTYDTSTSTEQFLEFVTSEDKIAGFLRLSFPSVKNFISELEGCAIIREIHVYGQSVRVGNVKDGAAQHIGLGKTLIQKAKDLSVENGFKELAVISSIGTREYYKKQGFELRDLYQIATL